MLKIRVLLLPLIWVNDTPRPSILKFFEIVNAELNVTLPTTPKLIVSPVEAVVIRSRKVPGPLSARLVTVIIAACTEQTQHRAKLSKANRRKRRQYGSTTGF